MGEDGVDSCGDLGGLIHNVLWGACGQGGFECGRARGGDFERLVERGVGRCGFGRCERYARGPGDKVGKDGGGGAGSGGT